MPSHVFKLSSFFRLLFRSQTKLLLSGIGELQKHLLSGTEPDGCILNDKVILFLFQTIPL